MPIEHPDRDQLATQWQEILKLSNRTQEVFGSNASLLQDRHDEDRLPHPGFVGPLYRSGGVLFLGMNPGSGGDGHDPDELPHYQLLRQLRESTPAIRRDSFELLMKYDETWYPKIRIMRTVVGPVLQGAGIGFASIAYMNVLKWRTSTSSGLGPLYIRSLELHTMAQLGELDPGVIAVLGATVAGCLGRLDAFQSLYGARCVTIPRTRGDFRLDEAGREGVDKVLERIRDRVGLR
jgi:hypothetical protein